MIYIQKFLHELSKMYLFTFSWFYFFLSITLLFYIIPILEPTINNITEQSTIWSILLIIISILLKPLALIGFFTLTFASIAGLGPISLTDRVVGISFPATTPNPTPEETIIFYSLVLLSFILSLIAIKLLRNKIYSLKFLLFWITISSIGVLIFYNNYQYINRVGILDMYPLIMLAHSTMMTICAFYLYVTRNKPWKDSMDSYSIFRPFSSPKNLE
ncbi:MAG: hypothetical protein QG609_122 [Patescibacteria group bacterium]|nr:hypothetical protein [Patescibacteria group bacterium]